MRAEFLKVRSLPTPFWSGVFLGVCFLIGLVCSFFMGVGQDDAVLDLAVGLPTSICSIVIGAWLVGLEFGQNTLRRVLSVDPRRIRLVLTKLVAGMSLVVGVTVLLWLAGMLLYPVAGSGHETTIDMDQALRNGAAVLLTNLVYVVASMGLAWITRSMAGGMTIAFVFFFVVDSFLSLIPEVGEYTLGLAMATLDQAIRGTEDTFFGFTPEISVLSAAAALAGWLILIFGAGIVRTIRTEVK